MTIELGRPSGVPPPTSTAAGRPFIDVYHGQYRRLVHVAQLTVGSQAVAEEIVQEAFADLYRRYDRVEHPDLYVRRAVVNRCTSWVRRRSVERRHASGERTGEPVATEPDTIVVMDAIGRLPTRQRIAVVLRYLEDWPEADIARALGCRPGTVKSLLSRARAQLAKELI